MTIKLDYTQISTVVLCSDCPFWFGFGFDREDGWRVGREHEKRAHPGATQATAALSNIRSKRGTKQLLTSIFESDKGA